MKKVSIVVFAIIIYLPFVLGILSKGTGCKFDVELGGFEDSVTEPEFSFEKFWEGDYQKDFTGWYDSSLRLRGVMTKTYASINYNLFNVANRPIGEDKDIFEPDYINAQLAIGSEYDYSTEEKMDEMQEFVDKLSLLNEKLNAIDKSLYVYITPSKAGFDEERLPKGYRAIKDAGSKNQVGAFRECIEGTNIPYMICADYRDELEYPAFYDAGIHWSRTYEQFISRKIISDLSVLCDKEYRNIILGEVKASDEPYWRDADVFELLNVWNKPGETFYEYETSANWPDYYDELRIFMYGDSFALGLRKDVMENLLGQSIYYVNYRNYVIDIRDNYREIDQDFNNLYTDTYLDNSEVVIIQMAECHIKDYTLGFVDYLLDYLDGYKPGRDTARNVKCIDMRADNELDYDVLRGFHLPEEGFVWCEPYSSVILTDNLIGKKGLELIFGLTQGSVETDDLIRIYVNGHKVSEESYSWPDEYIVNIKPEDLISEDGEYKIEIFCSNFYNPGKEKSDTDDRDLAIQIEYIGRAE